MNHRKKQAGQNNQKGNIRIIAGKHKGRKLPVIMAEGLRPTTDRVKETVFNWLMPYIQDSNCLDCFAGSGGLGFEALSRGADQVTFLEFNKSAALQLKQNQTLLSADNVSIKHTDALAYLADDSQSHETEFNLVFLDPPFRKGFIEKAAELLDQYWLAEDALIYIEMESEHNCQVLPTSWRLIKEKIAGQVAYRLYEKLN